MLDSNFLAGFFKIPSFKIAMSGWAGVGWELGGWVGIGHCTRFNFEKPIHNAIGRFSCF